MKGNAGQLDFVPSPSRFERYRLSRLPLHHKYRSHFEIIALILESVSEDGAGKFLIMKRASVNCVQLKKYLRLLLQLGFVELEIGKGRMCYRTSESGLEFLRRYYDLLEMLSFPPTHGIPIGLSYGTRWVSTPTKRLRTSTSP